MVLRGLPSPPNQEVNVVYPGAFAEADVWEWRVMYLDAVFSKVFNGEGSVVRKEGVHRSIKTFNEYCRSFSSSVARQNPFRSWSPSEEKTRPR